MFRYVALVWDPARPAQAVKVQQLIDRAWQQRPQLVCCFSAPGVRVLCTPSAARSSPGHVAFKNGVVLGTIFSDRMSSADGVHSPTRAVDERAAERIARSAGRELITRYWGNYVAVLHCDRTRTTRVLRGPVSSLPCLSTSYQGIEVFFSFAQDGVRIVPTQFSVDWDFVALSMITTLPSARTGMREVRQLRPGECAELRAGVRSTVTYWDAIHVTRSEPLEDEREAEIFLRENVRHCVHAWIAQHENVMLNLSGGLDSSIVLSCMADAPNRPHITAITEFSRGADSDEREYARLAVKKAGCLAHIERRRNPCVSLRSMLEAKLSVIPQNYIRSVEVSATQRQLARACGATAILSGSGGDQLFGQSGAILNVADFIARRGMRSELAEVIYRAAQLEGLSVWRVLAHGLREAVVPQRTDILAEAIRARALVTNDVRDRLRAQRADAMEWFEARRAVSPAALAQAYGLSIMDDYYDPMGEDNDAESIAPLFSQPLVETVLRIPMYVLMAGGWDRGLARRAFADKLPVEIARRRSKGGISEHIWDIFRRNLPFARELLLGGLLADKGFLDIQKVDDVLSDHPSKHIGGEFEIGVYLSTEAWLRLWKTNASAA